MGRWRSAAGQTAAELMGVLLVVAAVVALLVTGGGAAQTLRTEITDHVCAIAHGTRSCSRHETTRPGGLVHTARVSARTATARSIGAKRVAAANAAAKKAILYALLHPGNAALRTADNAIAAFNRELGYCTDGDRRPPWTGCPGLRPGDTSAGDLIPVYDAVHAVHDLLDAIWQALLHPTPQQPTNQQVEQALATFVELASGAKTADEAKDFIQAHEQDILDGWDAVANDETNVEGGAWIARGARNTPLRNVIKSLYRYNAKIGDGSTMDALEDEVANGCQTTGCAHFQKAVQSRRALNGILRSEPLSADERQIATTLRDRLTTAIQKAGAQ